MEEVFVPDKTFRENFFRLNGRLNRWRFFKRSILLLLIAFVLVALLTIGLIIAVAHAPQRMSAEQFLATDSGVAIMLAGAAILLFMEASSYCLVVRRLHDLGYGKTFAVIYTVGTSLQFITNEELSNALGLIFLIPGLWLTFKKGTVGANEYGPDPLNEGV